MAIADHPDIQNALREILDPANGSKSSKDIVTSGLVTNVINKDGNVVIVMEVAPSRAQKLEPIRKAAEKAVQALPGIVSTTVVLTAETAPGAEASRQPPEGAPPEGAPPEGARAIAPVPGVGALLAVASGKGGVGKSTTAVNLALAFKANGLRVGLLDTDVFGPSIPHMMGLTGKPHSPDGKTLLPIENHGIACMSIGLLVEAGEPVIWRGPIVMRAIEQILRDVRWGTLDVLVLDLPPGTGDVQLTLAQNAPLTGAVIVSTPQDLALLDARKGLNMFRKVHVPVLGIIENMSNFTCPHCGHQTPIFNQGGAKAEAHRLDVDFLGEIPLAIAIRQHADDGNPIVIAEPDGPHAKAYRKIADRIWEKLKTQQAESGD
ncbi:MAG: hypothetical protein COA65_06505 [Rhodospirillaceae bacterium]|nr:MAG: hypothetical protein COA65_06505 [Rhodospirillaceae bacterium]